MNAAKTIGPLVTAAAIALLPVDTRPSQLIEINRPAVIPASIMPGARSYVAFKSRADTDRRYPEALLLQEVDRRGNILDPHVATLLDDGNGVDAHEGDRIYSGAADVHPSDEGAKYFRTVTVESGSSSASASTPLRVSRFEPGVPSVDHSRLVDNPYGSSRVVRDQVLLAMKPGAESTSARLTSIAQLLDGSVAGFVPGLDLYVIDFAGDGSAQGVFDAAAKLESLDDVEYAEPNSEVVPLAFPDDPPADFAYPTNCGDPPGPECQWYLQTINAREAWQLVGGGENMRIAIIESSGETDYQHPELQGRGNAQLCPGVDPGLDRHATQVAGLIGAKTDEEIGSENSPGMAGLAYEADLTTYVANTAGSLSACLESISEDDSVRVINISALAGDQSSILGALEAVIVSANVPKLVVAAAGNVRTDDPCAEATDVFYPAIYNTEEQLRKGILAVGASTAADEPADWTANGNHYCSNRASWVDLYAPGQSIYSTSTTANYAIDSGTSFAAALVSAAAALVWAGEPDLSAGEVHDRLINSANRDVAINQENCAEPADGEAGNGCGRLDIGQAVAVDRPAPPTRPNPPELLNANQGQER